MVVHFQFYFRRNTFTTTPTSKHLSEKGKPSDVSPDIDNEMFVSEEIDEAFNNKLQEASFTSPTVGKKKEIIF